MHGNVTLTQNWFLYQLDLLPSTPIRTARTCRIIYANTPAQLYLILRTYDALSGPRVANHFCFSFGTHEVDCQPCGRLQRNGIYCITPFSIHASIWRFDGNLQIWLIVLFMHGLKMQFICGVSFMKKSCHSPISVLEAHCQPMLVRSWAYLVCYKLEQTFMHINIVRFCDAM